MQDEAKKLDIQQPAGQQLQAPAQPDPFDPTNLRLSQSFTETAGVKKLLTAVPVRKPNPQDFVRVHPGPAFRDNFPVIELKMSGKNTLWLPIWCRLSSANS